MSKRVFNPEAEYFVVATPKEHQQVRDLTTTINNLRARMQAYQETRQVILNRLYMRHRQRKQARALD
jgi:hypothetical protein